MERVGVWVGFNVGTSVGEFEGFRVVEGLLVGRDTVGGRLGRNEGAKVGPQVGILVGINEGMNVGTPLGRLDVGSSVASEGSLVTSVGS